MKSLCNTRVDLAGTVVYMVLVPEGRLQCVWGIENIPRRHQESVPYGRLHFSSSRNTSEILLSLKPVGILTAAPPAIPT